MDAHTVPAENPFRTKRVRPGSLPFLFPLGESVDSLVERLREHHWWGEIVGPHGSGKSTLLAALISAIEHAGRKTLLVELHDGQRRLPKELPIGETIDGPAVLIIDGYEQLSRWHRHGLKRLCRRRMWGLLVTSHKSVGLPGLYRTDVTPELAVQVVSALAGDTEFRVSTEEISRRLSLRGGDLRETLFDLYDLFEQSRSTCVKKVT